MAMIECGECGNEVSNKADECPNCGNPISTGLGKKSKGCLGLIVIIIGLGFWIGLSENSNTENKTNDSINQSLEAEAIVMCKEFVEDRLVSPATAEYPWSPKNTVKHDSKTWTIQSYVDSENNLGAKVRTEFTCKVQKEDDEWKLLNIKK